MSNSMHDAHAPTHHDAHPAAEPELAHQVFDELADLFLGDAAEADDTHRNDPAIQIERRALIVGHLPVAAAAWVAQHARDLAQQRGGPVAVVSVSGDHASLAVYGTTARAEPADSLTDAIAAAHRLGVCAWLVRTDALSEIALAEHTELSGITLLTGADEAALVKAYRALKALTSAAPGYEPALPALHLAVLGSDEATARPAAERLRQAAESFLDTGLTSVTLTPRIQSGPVVRLYHGHAVDQIGDIIAALPTLPTLPPAARPARARPSTPERAVLDAPQTPPAAADYAPLRLAHHDAANASRIGPAAASPRQPQRHADAPDSEAIPTPPTPKTPPTDPEPAAALLGLQPIDARCPYADDIEIAADAEGRAHLVAHAVGGGASVPAALESLEIARAWIEAHFTLIAAASGNAISVTPPREPATHLIVDHAPSARRLLDGHARIYVKAQGNAETLCVPLN